MQQLKGTADARKQLTAKCAIVPLHSALRPWSRLPPNEQPAQALLSRKLLAGDG